MRARHFLMLMAFFFPPILSTRSRSIIPLPFLHFLRVFFLTALHPCCYIFSPVKTKSRALLSFPCFPYTLRPFLAVLPPTGVFFFICELVSIPFRRAFHHQRHLRLLRKGPSFEAEDRAADSLRPRIGQPFFSQPNCETPFRIPSPP